MWGRALCIGLAGKRTNECLMKVINNYTRGEENQAISHHKWEHFHAASTVVASFLVFIQPTSQKFSYFSQAEIFWKVRCLHI